jgi:hypothetical protein
MSLPHSGKENALVKTTPSHSRDLTANCGSDSLSVAKHNRGFRDGDVSGAFSFTFGSPVWLRVLFRSAHSAGQGFRPIDRGL